MKSRMYSTRDGGGALLSTPYNGLYGEAPPKCKGVKGWTRGGPSLYKTLLSTLWGMYKFSKICLLTKGRGRWPQSPVITKAQLCMCNVQCLEPS